MGGKSVGKEYQIVKRGREYQDCGEEYTMEKRERVNNYIQNSIKNISIWEEGRGRKLL